MTEYIDREALLDVIDEEIEYESSMYTKEQLYYVKVGLRIARKDIELFPVSDVAPMKHGKWELCFEDSRRQIEGNKCSVCGYEYYGNKYFYCPNCGVRMDGDV